jgi:hypothetical protein
MELKITVWKQAKYLAILGLLLMITAVACEKEGEETTRLKAPLRSYTITARLDNKQAGTESQATGVLKGSYSEETKLFIYNLEYSGLEAASINISKGAKGAVGVMVVELPRPDTISVQYKSPLDGARYLNALQERDLIKGLWSVTISSASFPVGEIKGQVTLKQK